MVFKPDACSLTVIYKCKKDIDFKNIIENRFPIKNIVFKDKKLYNTINDKVIIDASIPLKEKENKYTNIPEGLIFKSYALSSTLMYYSYTGHIIPSGTTCTMCGVVGPNLHNNTCMSPLKSSLIINEEGLNYLDKNILKKFNTAEIAYNSIFPSKEKNFNQSIILLKYSHDVEEDIDIDEYTSKQSSISGSEIKIKQKRTITTVRIIDQGHELKVLILSQPWMKTEFYKEIEKQLIGYVYENPDIYITSIYYSHTNPLYNFDILFNEIQGNNRYNIIISRPSNIRPILNGPYENDPIDINYEANSNFDMDIHVDIGTKILIRYKNLYYNILKNTDNAINILYIIYIYDQNFNKLDYYYNIIYFKTNNYQVQFHPTIRYRYNQKNIKMLNDSIKDLSDAIEYHAINLGIKPISSFIYTSPEESFNGTVLGRIPPKMQKIRKKNGLATGVKNLEINIFNVHRKKFDSKIWILKDIDPDNELNVLVSDPDDTNNSNLLISVPVHFVRSNKLNIQTLCRDTGSNTCRPVPFSFMHGSCPEGIINMIMPDGMQSSYDARFYPCCQNISPQYLKDFVMYGFSKQERDEYLIPDTIRTEKNYDTLIDPYTGTLDPYIIKLSGSNLVIKNRYTKKDKYTGKKQKYVLAKFIRNESKSENKDGPKNYIVEVEGTKYIINGLDLHPMYREYRNFRGLVNMYPNIEDQRSILLSYLENIEPMYKIFFTYINIGSHSGIVVSVNDMYKRHNYLNRFNLVNLCNNQYIIDIIPKNSVYAEIRYIHSENGWYIIDIYGKGYILPSVKIIDKNKIIRGYLNYNYKDVYTCLLTKQDRDSMGKPVFYTMNDTRNITNLLNTLPFSIKEMNIIPKKIAKYLENAYNNINSNYFNLENCDIILYNEHVSYQLREWVPKEVVLKVIEIKKIDNQYKFLIGYKNDTVIIDELRNSFNDNDIPYHKFQKGDYVRLKINCIKGHLKKFTYVNMYLSSEKEYTKDPDIEIYVTNLLYQIDRSMFSNTKWKYSTEINGFFDKILEDNIARYNMIEI